MINTSIRRTKANWYNLYIYAATHTFIVQQNSQPIFKLCLQISFSSQIAQDSAHPDVVHALRLLVGGAKHFAIKFFVNKLVHHVVHVGQVLALDAQHLDDHEADAKRVSTVLLDRSQQRSEREQLIEVGAQTVELGAQRMMVGLQQVVVVFGTQRRIGAEEDKVKQVDGGRCVARALPVEEGQLELVAALREEMIYV